MKWYRWAESLNLLTTPKERLKTAFDELEGIGFFDGSFKRDDDYSIPAAYRMLEKLYDDYEQYKKIDPEYAKEFEKDFSNHNIPMSIYGQGGMNRYFVGYNGDLSISLMHSTHVWPETLETARSLGFKVNR